MKSLAIIAFVATLVGSAFGSPAPVITAAPRAAAAVAHCKDYTTTTSLKAHACPLFCVEPGSPLCPKLFCPLIPSTCPPGSTITVPPLPAPTTITATVTSGCTVTVEGELGCAICGCEGCAKCVTTVETA